jgi:hypothetical protein
LEIKVETALDTSLTESPDVIIRQAVLKRFVYSFIDVQAPDALFTLHFDWPTLELFMI